MQYDPDGVFDSAAWLKLEEDQRINLAIEYHRAAKVQVPDEVWHGVLHAMVENQVALGSETPAAAAAERLMREGLGRHEAVHAVGSVLMMNIIDLQTGKASGEFHEAYAQELDALTAKQWLSGLD